jgi:hypothetical protein
MSELLVVLGWIGLYAPMALGAMGSIMGCSVAGQAAIGAMLDTEKEKTKNKKKTKKKEEKERKKKKENKE